LPKKISTVSFILSIDEKKMEVETKEWEPLALMACRG
jgi:hypothetical protein